MNKTPFPRLIPERQPPPQETIHGFLNPGARVEITTANLPHWRQDGTTYFVTFRLADSLPHEKLERWMEDRHAWLAAHPEPRTEAEEQDYRERFSGRLEMWLDQGGGCCLLELPQCRQIVSDALRYFHGQRYWLSEFVVAGNHVHAIVTPTPGYALSAILHSWKSFSAKQIVNNVREASRRLSYWWDFLHERRARAAVPPSHSKVASIAYERPVWQKEYFDHIVRSESSLQDFVSYIRGHAEWASSPWAPA